MVIFALSDKFKSFSLILINSDTLAPVSYRTQIIVNFFKSLLLFRYFIIIFISFSVKYDIILVGTFLFLILSIRTQVSNKSGSFD